MSKRESVELTVLCLICQNGKILLQNRVKADWQGYTLPGGHVEPEESIIDAVIREMKEETGLTVEAPRLCGIKQFPVEDGRYLVFLFKTDRFSGTLSSSQEGQMEWVERANLSAYPTVSDLGELLSVMERDELAEFQYVVNGDGWTAVIK